ncbi:MAG: tRNA (adenosine(37)-N6)-threonylcarbamoyltransferase complex ATPase subunit type 1 TsaE [Fusobacteriaceae bacterium]|nr:tRNA (adenosine(37)-N6)-threonylcarbamoyltransferase complex ATPase subunit type 1 TsaE [Fusobacteriaceae bacterium]MBP6322907.1 tRNA (adenosine(37)-N6)-threonylcarbamoyltransferase complex ATPase subunit type 1 TsaE [Fusobacteriaceae bacterium]
MKKILSFNEIDIVAKKLANTLEENSVVALIGDLGTGKTSFVKTFAKELGVTENLKSPTFNYFLEYKSGRLPLYHFDVYRLSSPEEVYEVGYEDCLNSGGVILIEWANIIASELPKEYLEIKLFYHDEESRVVEINYIGNKERGEGILKNVDFSN